MIINVGRDNFYRIQLKEVRGMECDLRRKYLWGILECFTKKDYVKLFRYSEYDREKDEDGDDETAILELKDHGESFQEFVNSRLIFTETSWIFPLKKEQVCFERPESFKNSLYMDISDIDQANVLWEECGEWFSCIIAGGKNPRENVKFQIDYLEIEPDALMTMHIYEMKQGDFLSSVLPRLQKRFKDNIEVIYNNK